MIEEEKTEEVADGDGSGPITPPKDKAPRKQATKKVKEPVEEVVVPEPEIKTHKTYSIEIHVNDPLPQANDITVDLVIGSVTYEEATDTVYTSCHHPKYEALFNKFSQMSYYMKTDDAPAIVIRAAGKDWAMNLHRATNLLVNRNRNVSFFATEPKITNEEPI